MNETHASQSHFREGCLCAPLHAACVSFEAGVQQAATESSSGKPPVILDTTLEKLQVSSRAGCWFCSILVSGIQSAPENPPPRLRGNLDGTTRIIARDSRLSPVLFLLEVVPKFDNADDCPAYEFYVPREFYKLGYGNICAFFRHAHEISLATSSKESLVFAKEQLGECIDSARATNSHCERGITELPTRALLIEKHDEEYRVRLAITEGVKERYVTLSHCWGARTVITTTSMNLGGRLAGIRWSDLSHTFQDAVRITYELGFTYLWIDALCILQGDLEDWQRESGLMYAIYSQCALMISADHAADGQGGCFNDRLVSAPWLVKSKEHEAMVAVRTAKYHAGFFKANRSEGYKRLAPLATRAWAFQESTLAPRVLHFAVDELIWTCGGRITCQCRGVVRELGSATQKFLFKGCNIEGFVERIWYGLLGDYIPRILTKPEDRLPAMSGLAKSFEAQWKIMKAEHLTKPAMDTPKDPGMYLAGLWSNYLDTGLRWMGPKSTSSMSWPLVSKPSSYIAPSWSWASVSAAAGYFSSRKHVQDIWIAHAECTPDGIDPMGTVQAGVLVLSGPTIPLKLTLEMPVPQVVAHSRRFYVLRDYQGRDVSANYLPDYALTDPENEFVAHEGFQVCGLIMSADFVMLLRKVTGVGGDVYERIGSLNFLEGWFECWEQPREWALDAVRTSLTIV